MVVMLRGFAGMLLLLALGPASLWAQSNRDQIQIRSVRVGYPSGSASDAPEDVATGTRDSLYKAGAWTPVYVDVINTGRYDVRRDGPAELVIEAPDCDDTSTAYRLPIRPLESGESEFLIGYTRTGNRYGDFTIRVIANDRDLCQPYRLGMSGGMTYQNAAGLDPSQALYLALGSRLSALQALTTPPANPNVPAAMNSGRLHLALATRVNELPTLWFGYASADLVVLATSDRDFTTSLIGDTARANALAEWVRRGGNLLVCAGRNQDLLAGSAALRALLPVDLGPPIAVESMQVFWREGGGSFPEPLRGAEGPKASLQLTRLLARDKPARSFRVLVEGPRAADTTPLVAQGAYGLGRVTVAGIDLDQKPFTAWPGQKTFWEQLLVRAGPRIPQAISNTPGWSRRFDESADAELAALHGQIEAFEGVPVISFGWVALFILLYILVVGPLDYLFLKKVVKRLEFTWITFPTIVLVVSAAAYFTAYSLKGSELRINKSDFVDIDFQTGRVYGFSVFSVFSPRIQKYTVGLEASPVWGKVEGEGSPPTLVSWFGRPQQNRQSLFRHAYEYAPQATGLRGVPIQVWTTKGFAGAWQTTIDREHPLFENRLRHPPGRPDDLIGTVANKLPVPIEDALMIYRGEVAYLGTLLPETPRAVSAQKRVKFSMFRENQAVVLGDSSRGADAQPADQSASATAIANLPMRLLFHEGMMGRADPNNGSLRGLDQSWRVSDDQRDEVILVGRLGAERMQGPAEEISVSNASPTRIWLGQLPASGGSRPPLPGTLRQSTCVRCFLPITPEPRSDRVPAP